MPGPADRVKTRFPGSGDLQELGRCFQKSLKRVDR